MQKEMYEPNYVMEQIINRLQKDNPGPISKHLREPIFVSYHWLENPIKKNLLDIVGESHTISESDLPRAYLDEKGQLSPEFVFVVRLHSSYSLLAAHVASLFPEPYDITVQLFKETSTPNRKDAPSLKLVTYHEFKEFGVVSCYGNGLSLSPFIPLYTDPGIVKEKRGKLAELEDKLRTCSEEELFELVGESENLNRELDTMLFYLQLGPFFEEMEEALTTMLMGMQERGVELPFRVH